MAVVAHHPVIVELEGVALRLLAVDEDAAGVVYLQVVVFVNLDAAFVYRQIFQRQSDALALLRNPYRTVIISCPAATGVSCLRTTSWASLSSSGGATAQIIRASRAFVGIASSLL